MTKTPRTDEQLKLEAFFDGIGIVEAVEVEFAQQLEAELAEARAEIERLVSEIENKQYTITCADEENQQLKESLAEARAEIERKNALIEQMRVALEIAISCVKEIHGEESRDYAEIKAALSAAERGE